VSLKNSFDMPAMRRLEIERYARALDVADTDDFRRFLVAWQWHNPIRPAGPGLPLARHRREALIPAADGIGKYQGGSSRKRKYPDRAIRHMRDLPA
jgi:hypothetical protein